MKKLKKLSLDKQVLSDEELKMLVGGYDIINSNSVVNCFCSYNNTSHTLSNNNSVHGCSCTCK